MRLQSRRQLENSKEKLAMIETRYRELRATGDLTKAKELTLWSLGKIVKQLKEEIAVFEAYHPVETRT